MCLVLPSLALVQSRPLEAYEAIRWSSRCWSKAESVENGRANKELSAQTAALGPFWRKSSENIASQLLMLVKAIMHSCTHKTLQSRSRKMFVRQGLPILRKGAADYIKGPMGSTSN